MEKWPEDYECDGQISMFDDEKRGKAMSVKPILFNTEMVQAILDGRKTVTRRIVEEKVKDHWDSRFWECEHPIKYCKYQIGDILWVRETFCDCIPYFGYLPDIQRYVYKSNETQSSMESRKSYGIVWTPSIHMPKEAARIFLRVTDVRVEKLQDITEEQAKMEGTMFFSPSVRYKTFKSQWLRGVCSDCKHSNPFALNSCSERKLDIVEDTGCTWGFGLREDADDLEPARLRYFAYLEYLTYKTKQFDLNYRKNPYVWVIEFERCEKPEGWCK